MKIKNFLLLSAFFVLFFWSFANGQTDWEFNAKQAINQIQARFCDYKDEASLDTNKYIFIKPLEEAEFCMVFENSSEFDMEIAATIHPAGKDANDNRVCNSASPDQFFEEITTKERWTGTIKVPANSQKIQNMKVRWPIWVEWLKEWCLVRSITNASSDKFGMFDIKLQKAHKFDVLIQWDREIKNSIEFVKQNWNSVKLKEIWNWEYALSAKIKNNGNIEQMVSITWSISNRLWYNEKFEISEEIIKPNDIREVTYNIGKIPSYKWYFTVDVNIEHKPHFSFGADQVPDDVKKAEHIKESFGIFIMSNTIRIILWVVLALVATKIIRRKK